MCHRLAVPIALALFALARPAATAAQAGGPSEAAGSITADDVARRIGIIADDSMMGRDTPSRGLDLTARYIADEFRRFGLEPGGDSGTYFQRYPITRRRLDLARSRVVLRAGGREAVASLARAARYDAGAVPEGPLSGAVTLVGGPLDAESAARLDVRDRVVLYVPPAPGARPLAPGRQHEWEQKTQVRQQVLRALFAAGPRALLVLSELDSARFAAELPRRAPERTVIGTAAGRPPVLQLLPTAVRGPLRAAGVDLAAARREPAPFAREVPGLTAAVELRDSVISTLTAPNVVGILRGTDPTLREEYLVYSAHMDHIGITPGLRDSINNGADDDASGTAGVVELAEAFSRPGARPARSVIFLAVSGEEKGLWGSRYFTEHPPVPAERLVANINLDMIGRNWPDTIVAIGKEHSDLGATLERVNAAHPELGMTAIDDRWPEERFYFRSDHYNFARKGVPILFFFNGVHPDYHRPSDSPEKVDAEKEARILRLLYYLGREIGDAPERPKWKPESYREIVEAT